MRGTRSIGALICAGLVAILGAPALAEFTNDVMPQHVRDAQGYTFLGTLTRHFNRDVDGHRLGFIEFKVERLFAGSEPPRLGAPTIRVGESLDMYMPGGDGVRNLLDGSRYLFQLSGHRPGRDI